MPNLDFLAGQSPWLLIGLAVIAAAAWVLRGQLKRSGDAGGGKEGLNSADAAADYLAKRASEEAANAAREKARRETAERLLAECTAREEHKVTLTKDRTGGGDP